MQKLNHRSQVVLIIGSIIVILLPALSVVAQSVPALINYQGRLTDQTGAPLPAGVYGIQFRLWDTPTGSNVLVWAQQQSVSVQSSGIFNVILGAPGGNPVAGVTLAVNDLSFAFASSNRFLGLTVVSNNGVVIAAPSEILPRQQLLSVPFALAAASVIPGAIGSQQIANGAIGSLQIAAGGIQTSNLGDAAVTLPKMVPRIVGTNVPAGGLARSLPIDYQQLTGTSWQDVSNLTVTIQTTGRPVIAFLAPSLLTNYTAAPNVTPDAGLLYVTPSGAGDAYFRLVRDGGAGAIVTRFGSRAGGSQSMGYGSPMGPVIYLPPPGPHTYKVQWGYVSNTGSYANLYNAVLIIFEL